ncbi:hypothetical protein Ciccas_001397 [Cichlidogyrus casuarinus]|uniref:Uncharacterized protein n=1 Tax=Cichlidogyrus casuarinus TaxID=1844966 RepID=A0ABD2QKF8_9PLAT
MYLHEIGDPAASFTKEQMQSGKHTDYMSNLLKDFMESQRLGCGSSPPIRTPSSEVGFVPAPLRQISVPINVKVNGEAHCKSSQKGSDAFPAAPWSMGKRPDPFHNGNGNNSAISDDGKQQFNSFSSFIQTSSRSLHYDQLFPSDQMVRKSQLQGDVDIDFDPLQVSQEGLAHLMAVESKSKPDQAAKSICESGSLSTLLNKSALQDPGQHPGTCMLDQTNAEMKTEVIKRAFKAAYEAFQSVLRLENVTLKAEDFDKSSLPLINYYPMDSCSGSDQTIQMRLYSKLLSCASQDTSGLSNGNPFDAKSPLPPCCTTKELYLRIGIGATTKHQLEATSHHNAIIDHV